MAFVPPFYSKFGKSFSDLLKKKYDYKHSLTHKDQVENLTVETGVTANDTGLVGKVKSVCKHSFGESEMNVETDGSVLEAKGKHVKLYEGLSLQLTANGVRPSGQVLAEYARPNMSSHLQVDGSSDDTKLNGSVVLGSEGLAVGLSATYGLKSATVEDYNGGVEYTNPKKDTTVTVQTRRSATVMSASYFRVLNNRTPGFKTHFGAQLDATLASPYTTYGLTLATEHRVSKDLNIKAKIDTQGTLATVVEHRLDNPQVMASFAAQWSLSKKNSSPDRFGVGLTVGDI